MLPKKASQTGSLFYFVIGMIFDEFNLYNVKLSYEKVIVYFDLRCIRCV